MFTLIKCKQSTQNTKKFTVYNKRDLLFWYSTEFRSQREMDAKFN